MPSKDDWLAKKREQDRLALIEKSKTSSAAAEMKKKEADPVYVEKKQEMARQ